MLERRIMEYIFTRAVVGASPNSYILGLIIKKHLGKQIEHYPATTILEWNTWTDDMKGASSSKSNKKQQLP